ncbi:MAG: hypothetical protein HUJ75_08335, partial [Parasporobacterium sp.]|nr:hypothetical protein [Parasporobacterium sp.]
NKQIGYLGAEGHVSVGMKNVYDRIRISCGENYNYNIASVQGHGTIVSFKLPIWESKDEGNVMTKDTAEDSGQPEE